MRAMHNKIDLTIPESAIAKFPVANRSQSKLLCISKSSDFIADKQFCDLLTILNAGYLLVLNDSKVMPARIYGHKASGGKLEILVERIITDTEIICFIRASKSPKIGAIIYVANTPASVIDFNHQRALYTLRLSVSVYTLMDANGQIPLPPYFKREALASDYETYQTVYARDLGSVAAPTAGLHFTQELLNNLQTKGINLGYLTLHVGAGTFAPVRDADLDNHLMHYEKITVTQELVDLVLATKAAGNKVICVGTTSVRSLETAALNGTLQPFAGETNLFIRPGFKFKVVDALITNFHLPDSTLIQLVGAFIGMPKLLHTYQYALANNYRFYSYGDAMFIDGELSAI
jgi:S-adenosylmethionine:tRNA ribosyltransferase-isomerase